MSSSLENDISCLLESLHYLGNDVGQTVQAVEHLSEMALQDHGANIMNRIGAFSVILKLIFNKGANNTVVQKALILLGNATLHSYDNKSVLCNDQIVDLMNSRILKDTHNTKMIASGTYFLSCLCSSSEKIQNKLRKTKLLDRLVALYRNFHPKGNSHSNPSKEQWFEKAESNSPAVLTHISHALKSLMNKPKNVDNQIACSRLLNLALYTLGESTESNSSKIEALQFIADCQYENDKTQKIFNMIGGMRILTQLLKKELSKKSVVTAKLPLLNSILDTMIVAVTDHAENKENGIECGLVETMIGFLQEDGVDSLHMKCMMCLSELVHENDLCQKKMVSCNAIPEIVNIMSKKQDDMLSKIGTSILQNCIQYQDDLDGSMPYSKTPLEVAETPCENSKSSMLTSFFDKFGDSGVPEFLSSLVKKIPEPENSSSKPTKPKNLRRAKRCLLKNDETSVVTKTTEGDKKQDDMMGMLQTQNDLLQKFQDEIKNLRAEVHSQTASDYGGVMRNNGSGFAVPMTPSRAVLQQHRFATPSRRLYGNMYPGTNGSNSVASTESSYWTPQQGVRRNQRAARCINDELPLRSNKRATMDCDTPLYIGGDTIDPDTLDDDERPALCKKSVQEVSTPDELHQPTLYEKVHRWQKENANCVPSSPSLHANLPFSTPVSSKKQKRIPKGSPFCKPQLPCATPASYQKPHSYLQNAPKKKEPTKRRCPTTSDEGFYDDSQQTSEANEESYSGIRRVLSFERAKDELEPILEESREQYTPIPPAFNKSTGTGNECKGCNPSLLQIDSRNLMQVLGNSQKSCGFHLNLLRKLQLVYNRKSKNQSQPFIKKQLLHHHSTTTGIASTSLNPSKRLMNKRKSNWESMSVFSYRSERSHRSRASHASVRSGYTTMTSSNRRQRKDYSAEESNNILEGVERYGRRWTMILEAYPFKSGRTAVDLKDKYKKLKIHGAPKYTHVAPLPFTTQELVNLKHGVSTYGEEWPNILDGFEFESTRTPNELQEKWERLIKR